MIGDTPVTVWLVGTVVVSVGTAFAVWFIITAQFEKIVSPLRGKADQTAAELAALRTYVAETYVSRQGLRESLDQIMSGVRDIKDSVNHLNERIDGVISTPPPARRATSRNPG